MQTINVTVWNEYVHERSSERIAKVYPDGIHGAIAQMLGRENRYNITTATLDMPEHGLTQEVLDNTDVLIWWGHCAHSQVSDEVAERVVKRVWDGMGLIVLHSAHFSKIFRRMMGTECTLKWREDDSKERIWTILPNHPIAEGVDETFALEGEEMYGEPFDIPTPDEVVFLGWFDGGEVFRSGCTWTRGNGKIFYFQPGHETNRAYHNKNVQRILKNAVRWACPIKKNIKMTCPEWAPLERPAR